MSTDTLAQIEADGAALDALLTDLDGEITPDTEATIDAWFRELETRRRDKVDGYGFRIKAAKIEAAKCAELADQLAAKARTIGRRVDWLMARMEAHMTVAGLDRLDGSVYTFAFQANGGAVPLVLESENPADFPEECRAVTVTINKRAVRDRLEMHAIEMLTDDGRASTIPAHLGARGRALRLR